MIAQVYVDSGAAHLDRPFDYDVPASMEDDIRVGVRVKVRFNGRALSGLVVGLADHSDQAKLVALTKLVSPQVVAPAESIQLFRAVADHCAGTFMDVARLAIPPRHARSESACHERVEVSEPSPSPCPLDQHPLGSSLRTALRRGESPRVAWTVPPTVDEVGNWADGLAGLAVDTVLSGRSVILVVPDAKDCGRAMAAVCRVMDRRLVVALSADKGPQARYSAFLAGLRGQARVIVGTRAAVYAPAPDLGLIAVWDESDNSLAEPHFPYPRVRDIVAIRASQAHAAVVFASWSRSVEIQSWVRRGWLHDLSLPAATMRRHAAAVRATGQDDWILRRDPVAQSTRLPHEVFATIRAGLAEGPVLVWVPWLGARRNFVCRDCGEPMRCSCGGAFVETAAGAVACQVCGRSVAAWVCACGSRRWRAVTIGSARTAQELTRSFVGVPVMRFDSSTTGATSTTAKIDLTNGGAAARDGSPGLVDDRPCLVIATPGSEPMTTRGYAAAVVLDARGFLARPDIRAGEEAVRRWLAVVALVRAGGEGGVVLIAGPPGDRTVQAVLRLDSVGFAERELDERVEAGFPPATRMATFAGENSLVEDVATRLEQAGYVSVLGPIADADSEQESRLIARVPIDRGEEFAHMITALVTRRAGSSRAGRLAWRLDPDWLG
ncbi:MAG: hypothetical protein LBV00_04245 [Propionibacteriaceae bacterium]|jgi:primosomal protein N' (replication factor Y)|nr:hypothetical protein [Propionibacteriaceae bacterium]